MIRFNKLLFTSSVLFYLSPCFAQAQVKEIPLDGAYNFRDLGGYKTTDGKTIKKGKLYRAAVLSGLSARDLKKLEQLKVSRVADFRGPVETNFAPDKLPSGVSYFTLAAGSENDGPDNWKETAEDMKKNPVEVSDQGAIGYYRNIGSFRDRYRPLFDSLLTLNSDSALVFHCVGGKDRTGIAAALIEYALGVDQQQIMSDYLATNTYRKGYNKGISDMLVKEYQVPEKRSKDYGLAKAAYLEATFDEIDKQYGSMDNFLKAMGMDEQKIALLRAKFLE